MQQTQDEQLKSILDEIFIKPSQSLIENRFSKTDANESAGCTGRCESGGGCKSFV